MESQPQNPEFRINPENFHPHIGLLSIFLLGIRADRLGLTVKFLINQGSYGNGKTEFLDFSRTIAGLVFHFQEFNFIPILYKTAQKCILFSRKL